MSNDEKTTAAPVEVQQQANNKEVEEKELTKQTIEEVAKSEAPMDNGKTQQVESNDAKEAQPEAQPAAAPAPKAPKPTVHKADYEKDVVYLYQFSRTKNIPSPSPFCLKVETWLRMAGIKYEVSEFLFSLLAPSRNRRARAEVAFFNLDRSVIVRVCPAKRAYSTGISAFTEGAVLTFAALFAWAQVLGPRTWEFVAPPR